MLYVSLAHCRDICDFIIYLLTYCSTSPISGILQDSIKIDEDLLANSARSLETLVAVGMTLGLSKKKHPEVGLPNLDKCVL